MNNISYSRNKIFKWINEYYILIIIIVIGAFLRFFKIDSQSIWLDEVYSMKEASPLLSFSERYELVAVTEQIPPLYFFLLSFTLKIFGYTAFVARMFSAVVGVFGIYATYLLGKELYNKNAGYIAALLVSLNYFHLYYSQEARSYTFLFLFTTVSFYFLVRFLKNSSLKNGLLYGFTAALMIYGHFFGLLCLAAQYMLLLFFLTIRKDRKKMFINAAFSSIITFVCLLPLAKVFLHVSSINNFWIPGPEPDAYTKVFSEFFGNSEILLVFVLIAVLLYLLRLSRHKNYKFTYQSLVSDKVVLSFIILATWLGVGLLIPLVKSYLSTSVIISRYFIILLPAILLLVSFGITQFKNKGIQVIVLSLYSIFFLADIVAVKGYYRGLATKSQFREVTNFVIDNNDNNDVIISSLAWHMDYFFQNERVNYDVIDENLESYINIMKNDTLLIKPFWYTDAHGREYNLSQEGERFLKEHFVLQDNINGFGAWANHYVLKESISNIIDIKKFGELKEYNGDAVKYNLESYQQHENEISASGWAFLKDADAMGTVTSIVLIKDTIAIKGVNKKTRRPDIMKVYKSDYNLEFSGFESTINISNIEPGEYIIGLYMYNEKQKKEALIKTNRVYIK